ncbi:NUDIX domain-containing protein [Clostridium sp. D2Q-11]|uniref:NUDIX domain-containing protein n=1 Tax=Anaeromonas frigoriresistens TaxID=2683708 RepID=A0A942Z8V5_9FIRM|nr:NUDIX domain-containing protein [Anaeromonas frigoriresistens]MBS4538404.1 NUDIX domain-containing protein [Anaeromonas frigoriresistens]
MRYPEPTVGAIIFNPDNKILLCKSHKWNNKYIIPGGHIELGEEMEEALKREILEETGLEIYDIQLISIKESVHNESFHEKKHFIFIDYICKTDSYNVILNEEAQEYEWVDLKEIDNYDLGGFIKLLLIELKNKEESKYKAEIFYNY